MEDTEVVQAFVTGGARRSFGPTLHIEGDVLFFDGWWQAAIRIGPDTFALRDEEPPEETEVLATMAKELAGRSLHDLGTDFPLVGAITYAEIALGPVAWTLWAPDLPTGEGQLAARAGKDSFLGDQTSPSPIDPDFTAEFGGARRLSGLPPAIVLTVGITPDQAEGLQAALPDCRIESRDWASATPEVCNAIIPTLVVLDATADHGREFAMELRAAACGRFIPLVALTPDGALPLGADAAVEASQPPADWVAPIRNLLP